MIGDWDGDGDDDIGVYRAGDNPPFHPNYPPTLSNGYVAPASGDTSTPFDYYVTYTDTEDDKPTTKYVYVDGSPHTMTKISGSYTSGATFKYSTTTLSAGSHNYYFYFDDGCGHTVRLPTSGTRSGPTVSLLGDGTPVAYLKKGQYGAEDHDLYIYTAPTTTGQQGALTASDYWSPDGNTVGIAAIGMDKIAYLKKGAYGAEDYDLYIYTAPTTIGQHGTLLAADYWAPDGNTVGIAAVGMDKIAYLKKGAYGAEDYDLYVYTVPTTIGQHGTLMAADYWAPDGSTVGITALGMDKIAYLKKGAYGATDYDLYVYTAPTTIGEHGTLIASDYWSPDGNTVGITAIDGVDKIAYLKKGAYGYTDYDLYVYTAPTTVGEQGTLIASDYWTPDGQTEGISALG